MGKLLTLAISCAALCGCSSITATNGDLKIRSDRFLWKSEQIAFNVTNGTLSAKLTVSKSGPDGDALGKVAEGVARGLK